MNIKEKLDILFTQFNSRTTHRGEFSKKLHSAIDESYVDELSVFESLSISKKTPETFMKSLISGLAMKGKIKESMWLTQKVIPLFPEIFSIDMQNLNH